MTARTTNKDKAQPKTRRSSQKARETKSAKLNSPDSGDARLEKNWLEWTVFGFSLVLVFGIIVYLVYLEITPSTKDFQYEIGFEKPQEIHGRYLVPVKIDNKSNKSVQDVAIEISSGGDKESADLQLDYLPRHSHREATVFFREKPTQLEGHINSFNIP